MSTNELTSKIEALREWESVIEEAQAEAEALRDATTQRYIGIEPQRIERAIEGHAQLL